MTASALYIKGLLKEQMPASLADVLEAYYRPPAGVYAAWLKRSLDVIMAVFLIITVLSWLIPVLFIIVRLNSRGPLFFVQPRIGLNGRIFHCLKFRSMYAGSDKPANDLDFNKRITGVGLFLRRTHIDELPQIFNVLMGHMSLVGPRPHMTNDHQSFSALVGTYAFRHRVKPGITGLAQANGFHGNTPDYFSIAHRTRLDLFYVRKLSFALDMKILLRTCGMGCRQLINSFQNGDRGK